MNNLDRTTSVFFGWCSIGPSSALKWWKWCSGSESRGYLVSPPKGWFDTMKPLQQSVDLLAKCFIFCWDCSTKKSTWISRTGRELNWVDVRSQIGSHGDDMKQGIGDLTIQMFQSKSCQSSCLKKGFPIIPMVWKITFSMFGGYLTVFSISETLPNIIVLIYSIISLFSLYRHIPPAVIVEYLPLCPNQHPLKLLRVEKYRHLHNVEIPINYFAKNHYIQCVCIYIYNLDGIHRIQNR